MPGQEEELELTLNHDGRTYDLGTGHGHIALAVDDLDDTLTQLKEQGIEPEREPYRVRKGGSQICFVSPADRRLSRRRGVWTTREGVGLGSRSTAAGEPPAAAPQARVSLQ